MRGKTALLNFSVIVSMRASMRPRIYAGKDLPLVSVHGYTVAQLQ